MTPCRVPPDVTVGECESSALASRPQRLGQAEVEDLDLAVRCDLDVGGLQVAVDDAFVVCGFQRLGDLAARERASLRPASGRPPTRSASVSPSTSSSTRNRVAARLLEAVDRGDMRMVERREHLRLALEPREPSGSAANRSGRTLMATSRSSRESRARYTSPMPPAPSGERISYEPKRTPADSVTSDLVGRGSTWNVPSLIGWPAKRAAQV